ncbi:MAG TPA: fibronectin type III domain-containing protein [Thermoanaerobaculia bacterium]|nr:fibronectin type III domain-containing protein [Thermoanaerobaculia bacterium]
MRKALIGLACLITTQTALVSAQVVPTTKPTCLFPASRTIACNQSNTGTLEFNDCNYSSNFQSYDYDFWTFTGGAGSYVAIYAETSDSFFNPRVAAYGPDGSLAGVGKDHLFDSSTDLLTGVLNANGTWTVMITSENPIIGSKEYYLEVQCSAVPPPQPPASPTQLAASTRSSTSIELSWQDNASNEDEYRIEVKTGESLFVDIGGVPTNTTSVNVTQLVPGTSYTFRVRARRSSAYSSYSNEATATTTPETAACVSSETVLCLDDTPGDKRFEVRVSYQTSQGGGLSGSGRAIPLSSLGVSQGGLFWFFSASNPELLVKVLNGCGSGGRYWVFFSAGTNVGFSLTVRDAHTGIVKTYTNPDRTPAAPVQDTNSPFVCD